MSENKKTKPYVDLTLSAIKEKLELVIDTFVILVEPDGMYCMYNYEFKSIHLAAIKDITESLQKMKEYIEAGVYEPTPTD